jgi:hypothetical protein
MSFSFVFRFCSLVITIHNQVRSNHLIVTYLISDVNFLNWKLAQMHRFGVNIFIRVLIVIESLLLNNQFRHRQLRCLNNFFELIFWLDHGSFVDRSCGVNWSLVGRGSVHGSGVSWFAVSWSRRLIRWSRWVGGSFVVGLDVLGIFGFTSVLDVSIVTVIVGSVGDNLGSAIGELDTVNAVGHFTIAAFRVIKIVVGSVIFDRPGEVVRFSSLQHTKQS